VSLEDAAARVECWRAEGKRVVYTNGCFDLLHLGHVRTLATARAMGDALVVGLNGDTSARSLKGPGRPVFSSEDRAEMVAALECVDLVVVFAEPTSLPVLEVLRPDVWVKGGDYILGTVNQTERAFVESYGGRVEIAGRVPGASTTEIIARIKGLPEA
jgi:D-beta-D-heptose 7-phosphate kinase/D-beta-D-heptose 1-phosphate adenosyltransferase